MKPSIAFENILAVMSSQDKRLPPLWQVIYYEAIRGHHILFDHRDIIEARQRWVAIQQLNGDEMEQVCEAVLSVISCSDLTDMRRKITQYPVNLRVQLFVIFCHFVEAWRQHLKLQLN